MNMKSIINQDTVFRILDLYVNKRYRDFVDQYKQIYNIVNVELCNQKGDIDRASFNKFVDEIDSDYRKTGLNLGVHPLINQIGWLSVRSHDVGRPGYKSDDIDCRLYICLASKDIHKFSSYLYEKYKKADIPFYFKIARNELLNRKDNMVIYSSSNNLGKNLDILKELEEEHSDIISRCEEPSLIVSKVNSWIGYADNLKRDDHLSFSSAVCKAFSDGIEKAVIKYLNDNPGEYFRYKDNMVKSSDYLLSKVEYGNKVFSLFKENYNNSDFKNYVYRAIMSCIDEIEPMSNSNFHIERNVVKPYLKNSDVNMSDSFFTLYPMYDFSLTSIKEAYDDYDVTVDSSEKYTLKKDGIVYSDELIMDKVKFAYTWISATRYNRARSGNGSNITDEDYYYAFNDNAVDVYNGIMNTVLENNLDIRNLETKNVLKNALSDINYKYSSSIVDGLYSSYDSIDNFDRCFNDYKKSHSLSKSHSPVM